MNKNQQQLEKRREFIKLAIDNPRLAAEKLRTKAKGLSNCRSTGDIIYALKDILFLSERTIYDDFVDNKNNVLKKP